MKKTLLYLLLLPYCFLSLGQNTVGTISISEGIESGYTLFTNHTSTFLIDNCGRLINQWTSTFPPGNAVYLLEDGKILRAGRTDSSDIVFGGQGGVVEVFDWEGNLVWQYFYDTPEYRQHHDVYPMPNGNILILAVNVVSGADAIQAGRNPNFLIDNSLYNEKIIEVQPIGLNQGNIVWEWNTFDHLIQDFDNTKANFGNVSDNPQKIDINFLNGDNDSNNWLHVNSIQYSSVLDQIVISTRNLSEIWVIDHSTTTTEAETGSGGTYGKGGDLLYRWGNPQSYRQGNEEDRKLFGQHYPYFIQPGLPDEGKIIVYNNGYQRTPGYSEVNIISPPQDDLGAYSYVSGTAFGPLEPDYTYSGESINGDFFSAIVSSAQRLPNGNTLICEGRSGEFFEIDSNDNIVWKYVNPVSNSNGSFSVQGDPPSQQNLTFRAIKYTPDFAGFIGRDLTPGDPIELNPDLTPCESLSLSEFEHKTISLFPNPSNDSINIEGDTNNINRFEIYDLLGKKVDSNILTNHSINVRHLNSGVYILNLYEGSKKISKKIVKQ